MKNKELYIDPELEIIVYTMDDIIHTSVEIVPGVYDEGEIDVDTDMFDDENIDIDGDIDFFD